MLALYRSLLYLYPSAYRWEFGHEMMDVLAEVQAEIRKRGARERVLCVAREVGGLLYGALQEHLWSITGSQGGRRSEEHTSELQSRGHLVCRLLLEKKNNNTHDLSRQFAL